VRNELFGYKFSSHPMMVGAQLPERFCYMWSRLDHVHHFFDFFFAFLALLAFLPSSDLDRLASGVLLAFSSVARLLFFLLLRVLEAVADVLLAASAAFRLAFFAFFLLLSVWVVVAGISASVVVELASVWGDGTGCATPAFLAAILAAK